jgi:hypothetical protein
MAALMLLQVIRLFLHLQALPSKLAREPLDLPGVPRQVNDVNPETVAEVHLWRPSWQRRGRNSIGSPVVRPRTIHYAHEPELARKKRFHDSIPRRRPRPKDNGTLQLSRLEQ